MRVQLDRPLFVRWRAQSYAFRDTDTVVLSMVKSGFLKRKPCPGASFSHLASSSLNSSPNTDGSRRFIASDSVDLATGSMPRW